MRFSVGQVSAFCAGALVCCTLPAVVAGQQPMPRDSTPTAIVGATVIDVAGGRRVPNRIVVISGRRVTTVGPASGRDAVKVPRRAHVIDGHGKYVIPGLWDMHVHLSSAGSDRTRVPLLIANGVTGVRSMTQECVGDCDADPITLDSIRVWREASAKGERLFPRIVASGPVIDGPNPARGRAWRATSAEQAAAGVRFTKERGGDFVKVYSLLPRDAFFAVMREARRVGLPVAGHVPATVRPSEAADSGMASMEHDFGIWEECSSRASEWAMRLDSIAAPGGPAAFARISGFVTPEVMDSYDATRCAAVFSALVRNGTWLVPTLAVRKGFAQQVDSSAASDPRLRYVAPSVRSSWLPGSDFRASALGPAGVAARRERLRREPSLVGRANAAGVRILAGTDIGNPFVFPGFALHDELALLKEGGLTAAEALRSATLGPAEFLRATDSLGTVAPGKLADLVLLDADPLADIHNSAKIRLVVLDGRVLDRRALDALLAGVARSAADSTARP